MKKIISLLILLAALTGLLTACGEKSQEDVIEDLERTLDELTGYKTQATMTLQTGEEPQVYEVEVWYKNPSFYRVALSHTEKDQNQIILRNEEGVFVLTPALNKSFRFQSDWPENNSQVYLYESLMNDILMDPERVFTATEDHYTFQTNTTYTNKNLNQQEIMLRKKDLTPASVKVMDVELNVLAEVLFDDFQLNADFSEGDFDMDRNMTAAQLQMDVPAMLEEEEETDKEFTVFYPMYEPQGTQFSHSEEVVSDNGKRVILSYEGDQPFTLIQQGSRVMEASTPVKMSEGEPVDLGMAVGVFTQDGENKSVSWSYEGTDFFLISQYMEKEDLMAVARSVYGTHEK
ncbi:outer membrane lipoprotein carrier protein LolA [Salipaludibacillus sp. CUR1]|uniref:LolA family protein n=1 Tax=Salipaludibacillus sp. CUR1 TaxID=2820003 RepID=UPI001E3B19DC|nr:outer membrane lipoprotein carrier protein LolA [Salipaludibacillus sp. CUR1]MCE7794143.1 outer membrane lipoprotein carrier protein LolA [Salipaludibacillus sp. CUR1]